MHRGLKDIKQSWINAPVKGKAAWILTILLMGGGLCYRDKRKAILLMGLHALMLYYFSAIGLRYLLGMASFRTLNVQLYSAIFLAFWGYVYVINLKNTLIAVNAWASNPFTKTRSLKQRFQGFVAKVSRFSLMFKSLSFKDKFSFIGAFILMGGYQIATKHFIKGFLLLGIQVLYLIYFSTMGLYDFLDFIALNTQHLPVEYIRPSTFNLVYGWLFFILTFVFLFVYFTNIKNVLAYLTKTKKQIPAFTAVKELKDHKLYVSFLTFPVLGILAFTVLPLIFMISIAFTGYQGAGQAFEWVGINVFFDLLFITDNLYTLIRVFEWTLIWAFFATFSTYFGGILLASMINKKGVKLKKVWRTVFIISMATPQFVSLLIMNQMFAFNGPVNQFLINLGFIEQGINFWGNQTNARILIIVINMWIGIPYQMILTSGILMNIPEDLYEAAVIEGANRRQLFTKVTMPYMLFITAPLLVTGFIHNINNFNVIYLLTQGKPLGVGLTNAGGTDILITWLYQLTRSHRLYNLSAAIGIIIFIISATISLTIYRRTAAYKKEGEFAV